VPGMALFHFEEHHNWLARQYKLKQLFSINSSFYVMFSLRLVIVREYFLQIKILSAIARGEHNHEIF